MNAIVDKFEELLNFYGSVINIENKFKINNTDFTDENITMMFNQHCEENSTEIEIEELFKKYNNNKLYINSFDGYNEIVRLFQKSERVIYEIETNNSKIKCSFDHLIETPNGFVLAEKLNVKNKVLAESGVEEITDINFVDKSIVYDFEVNHLNHRYFAGGFSNHNSGKTFLSLSIAKNAQKMGYNIVWLDSENALDKETIGRFDIDQKTFVHVPIGIISEATNYIANLVKKLTVQRDAGVQIPKIMIVIDSLGNLSTDKEVNDSVDDNQKADFTRPKEIRKLFRVCVSKLGVLKIPTVITNHVYESMSAFSHDPIISGGGGVIFNASNILILSKAQLKENGEAKEVTGITVTSKMKKSRFTRIGLPIKFHISFIKSMNKYVGLHNYFDWSTYGIDYGKMDKGEYTPSSVATYTAVKHLGKHLKTKNIFTSEVFTPELLELMRIDLKKIFELPSKDSNIDLEDVFDDGDDE